MFGTNIASIFFYVFVGFVVLFLIPILIIWRIKTDKYTQSNNKASKILLKILLSLSKTNEFEIFYNVVIKEKFRKKKFIHIPGGLISKKNIYIFSDFVNKKFTKARIQNDEILINDSKNIKNVFIPEIKKVKKWITKRLDVNENNIKIFILHKNTQNLKLDNDIFLIPLINVNDLIEKIEKQTSSLIDFNDIKKKIAKENVVKIKNNSKNIFRGYK